MAKPFKPNDSRINRDGRPKGVPNKVTTEVRQMIGTILNANWEKFQSDWDEILLPETRMRVYMELLSFSVPKLKQSEIQVSETNAGPKVDFSRLTEEERNTWFELLDKCTIE